MSKFVVQAVVCLGVAVVCLQVLAGLLPHLLVPLVVLAGVFVVVRLVLFHTR